MKNTKRALLLSCLSLLLCISMLVGSTFAWFTDTASTSVSKIQAGTLKVDLVNEAGNSVKNGTLTSLNWKTADNRDQDEILWEPGCTYALENVYVVNTGDLAIKYKIVITGIDGNAKLNEVIDWTITLNGEKCEIATTEFHLPAGEKSGALTIEGKMQTTAGNEYQGLSIDGISITVVATQDTVEFDSYTDQYDKDADGTPDHPEYVYVGNTAELENAMEAADANTTIVLANGEYTIAADIDAKATLVVEEGANVTLVLGDNSITTEASKSSDEVKVNKPTIENNGNLTIVGGTISNKNATAGNTNVAAIKNVNGTLTLKDCTIENVAPTSGGDYALVVEGGEVVLENCTVTGNRGGIAVTGGSLKMTGGSVSANVYYPVYLVGEATAEFNGVTFTKQNNSKGKAIMYNALTTGSASFTDCTFVSNTASAINLDISKNYTGITLDNCTYTNVNEPN